VSTNNYSITLVSLFSDYESDTFIDDFYWDSGVGVGVYFSNKDCTFKQKYSIDYIKSKEKVYGYI
jgi:hypothetical protein